MTAQQFKRAIENQELLDMLAKYEALAKRRVEERREYYRMQDQLSMTKAEMARLKSHIESRIATDYPSMEVVIR